MGEKRLSPTEQRMWMRHLLPLPKQIVLNRANKVSAARLILHLPENKTPVSEQVSEEFSDLFRRAGISLRVRWSLPWANTAVLALEDVPIDESWRYESSTLGKHGLEQVSAKAKTKDQAYGIVTKAGKTWKGVASYAFGDAGLYYAAKTLKQLITEHISGSGEEATVLMPSVLVADYPDLPERGLWGGYAAADIPWLAERKFNLVETHSSLSVDENGKGHAKFDPNLIALARRHAVKLVPIIMHLDQLEGTGIFNRYPNVVAKGDPAKWPKWGGIKPVCWAQREAQKVLSDWMTELAQIDGVDAITVWLSEAPVQCECEVCWQNNQFVMETRSCLQAWEKARNLNPHLELRILLTQGSYPHNELVLHEVPNDVRIIYYHGSLTYNSSHKPMIYPMLEEFAKRGGWLGVCPQLTASWRIVSPFSGAHFIRERMEEFITKGLKCLYGYATPSDRYWEFNLNAAAEWSWNLNGRTTYEFAAAWATRERFAKPELVADWSQTLGPASWDVYACGIPYPWFFGSIARLVRERKVIKPGEGPLCEIPTNQDLESDIVRAQRALEIAKQIGDERLIAESIIILGYLNILAALPDISAMLAKASVGKQLTQTEKERFTKLLEQVKESALSIKQSLLDWAKRCEPSAAERPPTRFVDTVNVVEQTAAEIVKASETLF